MSDFCVSHSIGSVPNLDDYLPFERIPSDFSQFIVLVLTISMDIDSGISGYFLVLLQFVYDLLYSCFCVHNCSFFSFVNNWQVVIVLPNATLKTLLFLEHIMRKHVKDSLNDHRDHHSVFVQLFHRTIAVNNCGNSSLFFSATESVNCPTLFLFIEVGVIYLYYVERNFLFFSCVNTHSFVVLLVNRKATGI